MTDAVLQRSCMITLANYRKIYMYTSTVQVIFLNQVQDESSRHTTIVQVPALNRFRYLS